MTLPSASANPSGPGRVPLIIAGAMVGYPFYKRGLFAALPRRVTGAGGPGVCLRRLRILALSRPMGRGGPQPPGPRDRARCVLPRRLLHRRFLPYALGRDEDTRACLGFAAHIVYGIALIFHPQIYPLSTIEQQLWLGIWVFMPTPVYLYGIVMYAILSNQGFVGDLREQFGLDVSKINRARPISTGLRGAWSPCSR